MSKEFIGIGANPDVPEAHVHLVAKGPGKTGVAFCDRRTTGLVYQVLMTAADVTCKKCMEYKVFKDMIDPSRAKSPDTVGIPTAKTKPPEKKTETEKKAEAKKAADKDLADDFKKTKKAAEKKKATPKKTMEPYVDFAAVPNKDGTYKVKHIPSGRDFFDTVPASVIAFALEAINSLEDRWAGGGKPIPENYVATVRDAVKKVYKDRKVKPPEHLTRKPKKQKKKKPPKAPKGIKTGDQERQKGILMEWNGNRWMRIQRRVVKRRGKAEEKPGRVIKRRGESPDTKGKRQIKRRETPAGLNKYGQVMDKPPALIAAHLQNGVHLSVVISELQEKFGMTEKRAHSKFRAITRKMARRLGIQITHILMGDPSNDFYHIVDED